MNDFDNLQVVNYGNIIRDNQASNWLDSKLFSIVKITSIINEGTIFVLWSNDGIKYISSDIITSSGVSEWDAKARWVKIAVNGSATVSYVFKDAPTAIKIVDNSCNIVDVTSNALQIYIPNDGGNSIYTKLLDRDGRSLDSVVDALAVAVRDGCGNIVETTGETTSIGTANSGRSKNIYFIINNIDLYPVSLDMPISVNYSDSNGVYSYNGGEVKQGYIYNYGVSFGKITSVSGNEFTGTLLLDENGGNIEFVEQTRLTDIIYRYISPVIDYASLNNLSESRIGFSLPNLQNYNFNHNSNYSGVDYHLKQMINTILSAQSVTISGQNMYVENNAIGYILDESANNFSYSSLFREIIKNNGSSIDIIKPNDLSMSLENNTDNIIKLLFNDIFINNNSLFVAMTNNDGYVQASSYVEDVSFGDVGLYYALADISGLRLGTTNSDTSYALYVHLTDITGEPNPIPIVYVGDKVPGHIIDTSIGDNIRHLVDGSVNLQSLNLSNETPVPIWFKVYDISIATTQYIASTQRYDQAVEYMKLNFAVPPLSTRDVQFNRALLFNSGIAARVSTKHSYDASVDGELGSDEYTFISLTYH